MTDDGGERLEGKKADEKLFGILYDELRSIARHYLRGNGNGPFQPTELVHEACLKLIPSTEFEGLTERRLLGFGARAMRQVLADQARRASSEKHGQGWARVTLSNVTPGESSREVDLASLDTALSVLEANDARLAQMTELHYFAGFTGDQLAEDFGVSRSTVTRELGLARAMLLREIDRIESDRP